jgi:hypothetical protein
MERRRDTTCYRSRNVRRYLLSQLVKVNSMEAGRLNTPFQREMIAKLSILNGAYTSKKVRIIVQNMPEGVKTIVHIFKFCLRFMT